MALGALTLVEKIEGQGPIGVGRFNILGDGAYAGGSTGLLAKLKVLLARDVNIIGVVGQSAPATLSELEYDHANEKLFARVRTTGVESAVADQSAINYQLIITFC